MKREVKIGILGLIILGLVILNLYLFNKQLNNYAIVTVTLALILVIFLITYIKNTRSNDAIYKSNLRGILKSYDAILVEINNLPKLDSKNIIKVANIEELIDAQMEFRKPIYYILEGNNCSFILLDQNEACVYILKEKEDTLTSLEIALAELDKSTEINLANQMLNNDNINSNNNDDVSLNNITFPINDNNDNTVDTFSDNNSEENNQSNENIIISESIQEDNPENIEEDNKITNDDIETL